MGRYLDCGIATKITILKDGGYLKRRYSKEEILEEIGKDIELQARIILEHGKSYAISNEILTKEELNKILEV